MSSDTWWYEPCLVDRDLWTLPGTWFTSFHKRACIPCWFHLPFKMLITSCIFCWVATRPSRWEASISFPVIYDYEEVSYDLPKAVQAVEKHELDITGHFYSTRLDRGIPLLSSGVLTLNFLWWKCGNEPCHDWPCHVESWRQSLQLSKTFIPLVILKPDVFSLNVSLKCKWGETTIIVHLQLTSNGIYAYNYVYISDFAKTCTKVSTLAYLNMYLELTRSPNYSFWTLTL